MKAPHYSEWVIRDDFDSKTKYVLFLVDYHDERSIYAFAPSACSIIEIGNDGETLIIDANTKGILKSTNTLTKLIKKIKK